MPSEYKSTPSTGETMPGRALNYARRCRHSLAHLYTDCSPQYAMSMAHGQGRMPDGLVKPESPRRPGRRTLLRLLGSRTCLDRPDLARERRKEEGKASGTQNGAVGGASVAAVALKIEGGL